MSKKKKNILIIISIIILIITTITIGIYIFLSNIQKDKQKTEQNIQNIKNTYETFKNKIDTFDEKRQNVMQALSQGFYFETAEQTSLEWNKLFVEYDECVINIKQEIEQLDNLCNTVYLDNDINTKCQVYKKNYEIMVNTLINDIDTYNTKLEEYNTWTDSNTQYNKVALFTSKEYKEYIDYDKDNIYLNSKEES